MNNNYNAGAYKKVGSKWVKYSMSEDKYREAMNIWATLFILALLIIGALAMGGCTVRFDNPFYSPTTMDVNKASSTGANNYLPMTKGVK